MSLRPRSTRAPSEPDAGAAAVASAAATLSTLATPGLGRLRAVLAAGQQKYVAAPTPAPTPTAGLEDTPGRKSFHVDLDVHVYTPGIRLAAGLQQRLRALQALKRLAPDTDYVVVLRVAHMPDDAAREAVAQTLARGFENGILNAVETPEGERRPLLLSAVLQKDPVTDYVNHSCNRSYSSTAFAYYTTSAEQRAAFEPILARFGWPGNRLAAEHALLNLAAVGAAVRADGPEAAVAARNGRGIVRVVFPVYGHDGEEHEEWEWYKWHKVEGRDKGGASGTSRASGELKFEVVNARTSEAPF